MAEPKDCWDKIDILLKALVPIVIGISVFFWNQQRTLSETSAAMIQIAVGILKEQPKAGTVDALRIWAINVLQRPKDPPALTSEAALQLQFESRLVGGWEDGWLNSSNKFLILPSDP